MAGLANAPEQFLSIWRRVDVNHRIAIVLAGLGSAAAVAALVFWGSRPSYGLLYSDLSRKDAAAVVAQLESEGIAFRLADGGATVMVASDQVQRARAKLMMQGIPEGGDGFEILDKGSLGMTHFAERKTYLRAVQGELARTIGQVDAVEWARVHVTAPEPSVFVEDDRPSSASVLLKVRHGAQLSPTQVAAITSFVARSVEGLDPKNVTVTDQFLTPLSKVMQEEGPGSATAHLGAQHEIEGRLEKKVREMLEATVGAGRCSVSVCAEIALKQEELRETEYNEEGRVAKSEKTMTKKREGAPSPAEGGTVGADAVLGGDRKKPAPKRSDSETTSEETMEYEVPVKELHTVNHGVVVNRLTVSALVAGTHKTEKDADGKETRAFVPLAAAEMTKLTEAVKQAVGFDESRKDVVQVECVPFNEPEPVVTPAELASEQRWVMLERVGKHAGTVVLVLAFLAVVRSMVKRARAARAAAEAEAKAAAQAAAKAAIPPAGQPLRERVAAAIQTNPDAATDVLKTWYAGAEAPQARELAGAER